MTAAPAESTRSTAQTESDDERVRCLTCGTKNEPTYTFCRYCVARIRG